MLPIERAFQWDFGGPLMSALLLCLALMSCGEGDDASSFGERRSISGFFEYQGVQHVSWWFDQYDSTAGEEARRALAATGANWAGVLTTWYMEHSDSTAILPDAQKTPDEKGVVAAIRHFHELGLRVLLKPHVDVQDGTWRGSIRPANVDAWFTSYVEFMERMAHLAEAEKVEMLCVGTELARLSGAEFRSRWEIVLARVRTVYHGQLTYAANANSAADEFTSVSFWDLVDLAGLDAYAPLTDKDDPTPDELVAAWSRNARGDNMLAAYRNWQRSHGKPVILTEIGYRSANGANRAPWDYVRSAPYDAAEQADCYYAAFAVWLPERSWLKGLFWWSWGVLAPAEGDTGYTPQNKPAGDILHERFSGS
jgi:hypothetical protein